MPNFSGPPGPAPYGSCRPARCGRPSSSGDRRASVPRPAAAAVPVRAVRAHVAAGYRTTSATGRRSAIARRRWKTARRVWPSRRCWVSSGPGVRYSRDSRSDSWSHMIQSTFFAGVLVVISGISAGVRSKRERAGWCDIAAQMTIEPAAGALGSAFRSPPR